MSNQTSSHGEAQTVANALSGEKAFESVRFAVTGHPNADAISGIMAVLNHIKQGTAGVCHARHASLLLEYLAHGFDAEADKKEQEQKRPLPAFDSAMPAGSWPGPPMGTLPPPDYSTGTLPAPGHPTTTNETREQWYAEQIRRLKAETIKEVAGLQNG